MTPIEFQAFIDYMRWNRKRTGDALGVTQPTIRAYIDGRHPIPRHIALACSALACKLGPWPEVSIHDTIHGPKIATN